MEKTKLEIAQDAIWQLSDEDKEKISDGFHTFWELYHHRCNLFIALCKSLDENYTVVKSKLRDDGSEFEWWFIVQIEHERIWQISYHLETEKYRDVCDFIAIVGKANKRDGHTSDDVLDRLLKIYY